MAPGAYLRLYELKEHVQFTRAQNGFVNYARAPRSRTNVRSTPY